MRPMPSAVALVVAAVFIVGCRGQPDTPNPTDAPLTDEERARVVSTLLAWEDEWVAGFMSKDFAILREMLAPDFIYTVTSGEVHDKESFIDLLENEPLTFTRFDAHDVETHWYSDDVVVITGASSAEAVDSDGNVVTQESRWTNVFVQRNGEWQCVLGHASVSP